jgi:hypothetical protein
MLPDHHRMTALPQRSKSDVSSTESRTGDLARCSLAADTMGDEPVRGRGYCTLSHASSRGWGTADSSSLRLYAGHSRRETS